MKFMLGGFFSRIFKSKKNSIRKSDLLDIIDINLENVDDMIDITSKSIDVLKSLTVIIRNKKQNHNISDFYNHYSNFLKLTNTTVAGLESKAMLSSFITLFKIMENDLTIIRNEFNTVFSAGTDPTEITIEQMKMSHASCIGYIQFIPKVINFYTYMFDYMMADATNTVDTVPRYRIEEIIANTNAVASFFDILFNRRSGQTILTEIEMMRKNNNDFFIQTDKVVIDDTVNFNDYSIAIKGLLNTGFAVFSPILFVMDSIESVKRRINEERKYRKDWLLAKISLYRQMMQKLDTESADYRKLEELVNKLNDEVTKCDKAIHDFEVGHG